jgi:NADH-quinone oxidoreductase subunit C
MDSTPLVAWLQEILPGVAVQSAPATADLHATILVAREHAHDVLRELRDRPDARFALLAELTAVDYWPREPRFEIVYILVSIEQRRRVRVKVALHGNDAHLATVSDLWPGANWLEREVWDMFGVVFDGHGDIRRLLMPEDWEGHPLRKDYPVQIRMQPHVSEPMQVTAEEFRASVERDRLARK